MIKTIIGMSMYGLTTATIIRAPRMDSIFCIAFSIDRGINSSIKLELFNTNNNQIINIYRFRRNFAEMNNSTYPRSREKRFNILPDGLISKNRNDVEMIPLNIML